MDDIKKGYVICGQQFTCHYATEFEAMITIIDPPQKKVISNGYPAVLHMHTIQEEVEIKKVKSNKDQKRKGGLLTLKQGESGVVILRTELPICVEKFDEFPTLARFSLRAESS